MMSSKKETMQALEAVSPRDSQSRLTLPCPLAPGGGIAHLSRERMTSMTRYRGRPISLEALPRTHKQLSGTYAGETDDGCPFQLYVSSGTRRASGHEIVRAQINSMTRGRPLSQSDLMVPYDEIYMIIGNGHRKDVSVNPNGSYFHGRIVGRTFEEVVVKMLETFAPAPKPKEEAPQTPSRPRLG